MAGLKKVPSESSKLAIAGTSVFEKAVHLAGKTTDINPLTMIMLSRPSADYSHAQARKLLGYKATVTLEKGMQRCEAWLAHPVLLLPSQISHKLRPAVLRAG